MITDRRDHQFQRLFIVRGNLQAFSCFRRFPSLYNTGAVYIQNAAFLFQLNHLYNKRSPETICPANGSLMGAYRAATISIWFPISVL